MSMTKKKARPKKAAEKPAPAVRPEWQKAFDESLKRNEEALRRLAKL